MSRSPATSGLLRGGPYLSNPRCKNGGMKQRHSRMTQAELCFDKPVIYWTGANHGSRRTAPWFQRMRGLVERVVGLATRAESCAEQMPLLPVLSAPSGLAIPLPAREDRQLAE